MSLEAAIPDFYDHMRQRLARHSPPGKEKGQYLKYRGKLHGKFTCVHFVAFKNLMANLARFAHSHSTGQKYTSQLALECLLILNHTVMLRENHLNNTFKYPDHLTVILVVLARILYSNLNHILEHSQSIEGKQLLESASACVDTKNLDPTIWEACLTVKGFAFFAGLVLTCTQRTPALHATIESIEIASKHRFIDRLSSVDTNDTGSVKELFLSLTDAGPGTVNLAKVQDGQPYKAALQRTQGSINPDQGPFDVDNLYVRDLSLSIAHLPSKSQAEIQKARTMVAETERQDEARHMKLAIELNNQSQQTAPHHMDAISTSEPTGPGIPSIERWQKSLEKNPVDDCNLTVSGNATNDKPRSVKEEYQQMKLYMEQLERKLQAEEETEKAKADAKARAETQEKETISNAVVVSICEHLAAQMKTMEVSFRDQMQTQFVILHDRLDTIEEGQATLEEILKVNSRRSPASTQPNSVTSEAPLDDEISSTAEPLAAEKRAYEKNKKDNDPAPAPVSSPPPSPSPAPAPASASTLDDIDQMAAAPDKKC